MGRATFLSLALLLAFGWPAAVVAGDDHKDPPPGQVDGAEKPAPRDCCKHCRKGKACGDTCISRKRECHKPKGCACDA